MASKVFFSKGKSPGGSPQWLALLREALSFLFPTAALFEWPDTNLKSPHSFFLRDGENILWVEFVSLPFSRNEIPSYLQKAKQIQSAAGSGISGILFAPDFEAGVRELLEFIRIPVRLFRCQEAIPLGPLGRSSQEMVLWFQEMMPSTSNPTVLPLPFTQPDSLLETSPEIHLQSSNRLSREELREFIQLELDVAAQG